MGHHLGVPLLPWGLADERQLTRAGASVNLAGTRVVVRGGGGKGGAEGKRRKGGGKAD